MGLSNGPLTIVAVVAVVVGGIALILSVVSVSRNGGIDIDLTGYGPSSDSSNSAQSGSISSDDDSDRIWQLSFEHVGRTAYIDDATGELRGFHVDLATAVCQIARKNCAMVYDTPQHCWDSQTGSRPQGGVGLFARYYDACVGWIQTYERPRTFKFSDPHSQAIAALLVVKKGNPTGFEWTDLTNAKIGIVDGWAYDEHCIARLKDRITGWDLSQDQIVHYDGRDQMLAGLLADEVDAVFDYEKSSLVYSPETEIASDPITSCFQGAASLMMRKDNRLDSWWNPALASLMADTIRWKAVCDDISDEHGHITGPEADEFCLNYE